MRPDTAGAGAEGERRESESGHPPAGRLPSASPGPPTSVGKKTPSSQVVNTPSSVGGRRSELSARLRGESPPGGSPILSSSHQAAWTLAGGAKADPARQTSVRIVSVRSSTSEAYNGRAGAAAQKPSASGGQGNPGPAPAMRGTANVAQVTAPRQVQAGAVKARSALGRGGSGVVVVAGPGVQARDGEGDSRGSQENVFSLSVGNVAGLLSAAGDSSEGLATSLPARRSGLPGKGAGDLKKSASKGEVATEGAPRSVRRERGGGGGAEGGNP